MKRKLKNCTHCYHLHIILEKNRVQELLKQIDGKEHNEFMGVDVNAFTKEELIKILSLQQRKWREEQ